MNPDDNQQAYDRGVNIFSPDGRLYQVEYAREAVQQGAPSAAVCTDSGVVLAAQTRVRSDLMVEDSVRKLHKADDHIGVATAGLGTDGRKLVDQLRVFSQRDQVRYGEASSIDALTRAMADHIQEYTQAGGRRPYGASLLIGGVDHSGAHLYEVEPSGTPTEWDAIAVGENRDEFMSFFESEYTDDLSLDAGVDLAIDAFDTVTGDVSVDTLEIAVVSTDTESYEQLDDETLTDHFAELDIDTE